MEDSDRKHEMTLLNFDISREIHYNILIGQKIAYNQINSKDEALW